MLLQKATVRQAEDYILLSSCGDSKREKSYCQSHRATAYAQTGMKNLVSTGPQLTTLIFFVAAQKHARQKSLLEQAFS